MRYVFDHDLHIHTHLSLCSNDPEQTTDRILDYAVQNDLKTVCVTDHFWDSSVPGASGWYIQQDYAHIEKSLPLPKERAEAAGVNFMFGCETDLDRFCTLGVSPEIFDRFGFIIIPTTHLHMDGFTCNGDEGVLERARLWVDRLDAVLDMELPFYKIGIAHLTCTLTYREHWEEVLRAIPDSEYRRVFARCAKKGLGIELNFAARHLGHDWDKATTLHPFLLAREEGCKFYFGSDAHHPKELDAQRERAELTIDLLDLKEEDKFRITHNI